MRILFDTNVVLDFLLEREPFEEAATRLFIEVAEGRIFGLIGATTVTTIHYLAQKHLSQEAAKRMLSRLLQLFAVAPVTQAVLQRALESEIADYEDAVLHEAAVLATADGIVTRDLNGFRNSAIPVYSPVDLLDMLGALRSR